MDFSPIKSKKLWVTILGSALITIGSSIGIPESVATQIVGLVASYVIGQGIADFGKERAKVERLG